MPRNGSGIYSKPFLDVVEGTTIESAVHNGTVSDIETDLNAARPIIAGGTGATNAVDAANNLGLVSTDGIQTLTDAEKAQARANIAAAPFDAMAYNGMQINGSMDVSQELGVTGVSLGAGNVTTYTIDGWIATKTGSSTFSVAQVGPSLGFPLFEKHLQLDVTTAQPVMGGDYVMLRHPIEGHRFARARWGTVSAMPVTVGLWVYSSVAGPLVVGFTNAAFTVLVSTTATVISANIAQYITVTFAAQTTGDWNKANGVGAHLQINVAPLGVMATVGNVFALTGVVVLPGTQAPTAAQSPLIMRPYDQELVTCQRYFYNGLPALTGAMYMSTLCGRLSGNHPVPMRVAPTVTITSPVFVDGGNNSGTLNSVSNNYSTAQAVQIDANMTASTLVQNAIAIIRQNGGGNISVDARL